MAAAVYIYKSAFRDEHEVLEIRAGKSLRESVEADWDNAAVFINGKAAKADDILCDGDQASVRMCPGATAAPVLVYAGISLLVSVAIAEAKSLILYGEEFFYHSIKELMSKSTNPSDTETIPTISGGSNSSGKGKVIPIIIGETYYTPDYCAQSYTSIDPSDGSDGERQYFNALHMIGYRDVDVKSVSLGIYTLTSDEHDGTSGALTVLKDDSRDYTAEIHSTFSYGTTSRYGSSAYGAGYSGRHDGSGTKTRTRWISVDKTKYRILSYSVSDISVSGPAWKKTFTVTPSEYSGGIKLTESFTASGAGSLSADYNVSYTLKPLDGRSDVVKYDPDEYFQRLELRQDAEGTDVSLYPQKVVQEDFNSEMTHPEGAYALVELPYSARYPQKCELEIQFSGLIRYNDEGSARSTSVRVGIAYSMDGGVTYKAFPAFSASSGDISISSELSSGDTFQAGSSYYTGQCRYVTFTGKKNKVMRFIASKEFSYSEAMNCENHAAEFLLWRDEETAGDTQHNYTVTFNSIRTWCYDYEKSAETGTEDSDGNFSGGTLVRQSPLTQKAQELTARLGFRIMAGTGITGSLDKLSVIVQSRARICTVKCDDDGEKTYEWTSGTYPTSNPASLALMILQHEGRGEYAYTDSDIDLDSFGRFYEWCDEINQDLETFDGHRFTANGAFSRQMKTIELVNQILAVGHGRLVMSGTKYGVWIDQPQDFPVLLLCNQNILEFGCTKNFDEDIDGYNVTYVDSANDFQETTQIVVDNKAKAKKAADSGYEYQLEDLELPFVTDIQRVYRECMYRLACRRLRPETWTCKVGIDGNLADYGDMVDVQTDTLSVGIGDGAEITALIMSGTSIIGIKTDGMFPVTDASQEYGVRIMKADGTNGISVVSVKVSVTEAGIYSDFEFEEAIDTASGGILPGKGDFVAFGFYTSITAQALVFGKKDNGDGTFQLTLVPYQEGVYSDETLYGSIPEFDSKVTPPTAYGGATSESRLAELAGKLTDLEGELNSQTYSIVTDALATAPVIASVSASAQRDGIQINAAMESGKYNTVQSLVYEISKDGGASWSVTGVSDGGFYTFDRSVDGYPEADEISQWSFRVKAYSVYGLESEYRESVIDVSNYGTWRTQKPDVTPRISGRSVSLVMTQPDRADGREVYGTVHYRVLVRKDEDEEFFTPATEADPYDSEDNYRQEGTDGIISSGTFQQILPLEGQNSVMRLTTVSVTTTTIKEDGLKEESTVETTERAWQEGDGAGTVTETGTGDTARIVTETSIEERTETEETSRAYEDGDEAGTTAETSGDGSVTTETTVTIEEDAETGEKTTHISVKTTSLVTVISVETVTLVPNMVSETLTETTTREYAEGDTAGTVTEEREDGGSVVTVTEIAETDASNPVDTAYTYRVFSLSLTSGYECEEYTDVRVIALATSARDIVSAAITTNKLAEGAVTMDKLHANSITAEKMASRDLSVMNLVLGKVSGNGIASDSDNYWNLETGEFRIGNSITYEDTETGEPKSTNASYLHFKEFSGDGVKGIAIAISRFVITSIASIIKGVFHVKTNSGESFFSVNPEESEQDSVPARTVSIAGDLNADGDAGIAGALSVGGNTEIGGSLAVTGASTLSGAVSCGSTLKIPTSAPSSPSAGMIWIV